METSGTQINKTEFKSNYLNYQNYVNCLNYLNHMYLFQGKTLTKSVKGSTTRSLITEMWWVGGVGGIPVTSKTDASPVADKERDST